MSKTTSGRREPGRFRAWLRNAFATGHPDMTRKDEALLADVAAWVVDRRLATPVCLFLESYRPLGYLSSQALLMAKPVVAMALQTFPDLSNHLDEARFGRFVHLLEHRTMIGHLIMKIEEAEDHWQSRQDRS